MVIQVPLTCMVSTTVALQDILIYVNIFVRGIASANSSSSIDSIGSAIISQLMWFLVLAGGSCEHVFKVSQWARFHHNFRIRIWVQFFCLVGTPLPTSRAGKNPLGGEINKILALVQTMAWRLVTLRANAGNFTDTYMRHPASISSTQVSDSIVIWHCWSPKILHNKWKFTVLVFESFFIL